MLEAALEKSTSGNILILPSLKRLQISSCGIAGGWLNKMLPYLHSLEELILRDCPQIKWLSISQPTETEGSNSLVSAAALSAEDQMLLLKVPSNILYSLKRLRIGNCVDLEFYGAKGGFGGFTTLKELDIYDCPKLVSSLVSDTKDDTSSVDVGLLPPSLEVLYLSRLPENLQSYFPKGLVYLKKLTLTNSPCLKCVRLHSCTALEELQIWCQKLGALEGLQFLSSLRSLGIQMNPDLSAAWDRDPKLQEQEQGGNQIGLLPLSIDKLEISNLTNSVMSRVLSCLPAITKLVIRESSGLTYLQLGYCKTLTELEITHCESLVSIEGFQSITNLTSLALGAASSLHPWMELSLQQQGVCEVLSRLKTFRIFVDASVLTMSLCKQLTSLQHLEFWGEETSSMVKLTDEQERALQLLNSLQILTFSGFPNLLSVPANLRSLVSLKSVHIISCPSISGLPEMATTCSLFVFNCSEELSSRYEEWEQRREMMEDETLNVN